MNACAAAGEVWDEIRPAIFGDRAIQQAANEAVHNEARARSLATELRTQTEMLNERQDTGQTTAKGSRITTSVLVGAAKAFAALHGRDHVLPDDVQDLAPRVLAHRLILGPGVEEADRLTVVRDVVEKLPAL